MSMSNAERQRLFKARRRERLAVAALGSSDDVTPAPAVAVTSPAATPPPAVVAIPDPSPAPVAAVAPSATVTLADLAAELGLDNPPAAAPVAPIIESVSGDVVTAGNGQGEAATGATSANPAEPARAPIIESVTSEDNGQVINGKQSSGDDDEARGKRRRSKAGKGQESQQAGKAPVRQAADDEKAEKVTGKGEQVTTVTGKGGTEAPAVIPSPAMPARARHPNPIVPIPRTPLCEPAGNAAYIRAKGMLAEGRTWVEIETETGMFRQPYVEAAYVLDDWQGFTEAEAAQKAAIGARIAGKAMACAWSGERRRTRTKNGKDGLETEETVETYADPAFARIAGEYSDPATHGKQAGRQAPGVTVNVAMMQPAEAGAVRAETLSTATPLPPRRRTIDV